jgi:hypothetical protein
MPTCGPESDYGFTCSPLRRRTARRWRAYQLEPQLITALSEDKNRTKRSLVTYKEIPSADGAGGAGD